MRAPSPAPHDYDTVTRRLGRSLTVLHELVGPIVADQHRSAAAPALRVDRPFAAAPGSPPVLRTTGRLSGSGLRFSRFTRVDLELMAWSEHVTEVRLRPVSRRIPTWTARRQRRYFAVAHRTIDELVRALDRAAGRRELVDRLRRTRTVAGPHTRVRVRS